MINNYHRAGYFRYKKMILSNIDVFVDINAVFNYSFVKEQTARELSRKRRLLFLYQTPQFLRRLVLHWLWLQ